MKTPINIDLKPTNLNIIRTDNVYITWLKLLEPFHHLTSKEIEVAALFVESYIFNKGKVINDDLLNQLIFSTENKKRIRLQLKMSPAYFQIILKGLKNKNFYKDGKINLKYIPCFNEDGDINFMYMIKKNNVPKDNKQV